MIYPHLITVVIPAVSTGPYNEQVRDYGAGATRVANVPAFVQQTARSARWEDGRNPYRGDWYMTTDYHFESRYRVEWEGLTFEMDGQPQPIKLFAQAGFAQHYEVALKIVEG